MFNQTQDLREKATDITFVITSGPDTAEKNDS